MSEEDNKPGSEGDVLLQGAEQADSAESFESLTLESDL